MLTPDELVAPLASAGYVLIPPEQLCAALDLCCADLDELQPAWEDLPRDRYLRDGGHYRSRRHACFLQQLGETASLERVPHRAHWQSTQYNALHGGIQRWFEPISSTVTQAPIWTALLIGLGNVFARRLPTARWHIEAHQFRIDTTEGIGRPTPEGAHRDGVDFVAILLVRRRDVRGGETRVFEAQGSAGVRFTMQTPWTTLLLDDERVIHETTPIQPDVVAGVRDTLVLTYRARGFQTPPG